MEVDALITSVSDQQLPRCLDAVNNQTIPFSKVVHLDCVCPTSEAFNSGMSQTTGDWVVHLGGDMILDRDALSRMVSFMESHGGDKISGYYFGLRDTFLKCRIGYLSMLEGKLYRNLKIENHFVCDNKLVQRLKRNGWSQIKNLRFVVGTHFDQPDEYQVFTRCYIHGVRYARYPKRSLDNRLAQLFKQTGSPLYQLGIRALKYGEAKKYYPGSHNLIFDRENYSEWTRNHKSN